MQEILVIKEIGFNPNGKTQERLAEIHATLRKLH